MLTYEVYLSEGTVRQMRSRGESDGVYVDEGTKALI